jgi:hypothetical protein
MQINYGSYLYVKIKCKFKPADPHVINCLFSAAGSELGIEVAIIAGKA